MVIAKPAMPSVVMTATIPTYFATDSRLRIHIDMSVARNVRNGSKAEPEQAAR